MKVFGVNAFEVMMVWAVASGTVSSAPLEASATVPGNASSSPSSSSPPILPKTIFSSKLRMVFAVGLEGTGHDYLLQVDDDLFAKNRNLVRLPYGTGSMYHYLVRTSMGSTAHFYEQVLDLARADMRKVAQRGASLPSPGTVLIIHGRYSYPFGDGQNKALMYFDLRLMAEVAEAEGVDFRVVYLRRPVKDVILANTVHRRFQDAIGPRPHITLEQRFMEYMQIVFTDIAVMHSFLSELDPAFVICHDFERVGDVEQSSSIAKFIAPNAEVAVPLRKSLIAAARTRGASDEHLPFYDAHVVALRLQRKIDSLESGICNRIHLEANTSNNGLIIGASRTAIGSKKIVT